MRRANAEDENVKEWHVFVGYDDYGRPIYVTVEGIPEAN